MSRTSRGSVLYRIERIIALRATDFPDPVAGYVLAERERERRVQLMVSPRADDLGEPHDLAMRIGDLQAHAGLAWDSLDHADAIDGQCAREVLHQVDDLAAFHADGGLHLVASDHGPRI